MRHISNIESAVRERFKRLAQAGIAGVFSLVVIVTSGFALLVPAVASAAPAAPTGVQVITGGNSIALLWDVSPNKATSGIKNYEVYRNGTKVATVTPDTTLPNDTNSGNRYIDTAVTGGTTYQYQIDAVGTDNSISPLSATVSATQPTAANTTPVPTLTLDTAAAPDLATRMQTVVKPVIETWYPKMADAWARGSYTPISAFTLRLTTAALPSGASAQASSCNMSDIKILFNDVAVRGLSDTNLAALVVHESTHILQGCITQSGTDKMEESAADYSRVNFYRGFVSTNPKPNYQFANGYYPGAFFLNWVQGHYDANIVRKANIALHNNTYDHLTFWTNNTGKTEEALWTEMSDPYFSAGAPISGISSKCIRTYNDTNSSGSAAQIAACNSNVYQQWNVLYTDTVNHDTTAGFQIDNSAIGVLPNGATGSVPNYCLDVYAAGTADGTSVVQWQCIDSFYDTFKEQLWKTGANGSIINPNSGKCLQPVGGSSTDGTALEIRTCNGSAAQNWKVWFTNSNIDKRYASDQTFRTNLGIPTVAETTSGIYTYKGYSNGRAYNTTRSGVHEVSGAIWTQYNATGAHTAWGEPTTDEKPTPDGVGRFNEFYGAGTSGIVSIYWSPSSNAHVIHGLIRDRWGVTGWEAGLHGYPTSDEAPTPNGLARFNNFQNGGIYWSSGTGAQSVWGAIYSRWGALGYENSFLGLPTTSELSTPDGVGRYNVFQSGSIYWSPSTGAWSVGGAIRDRWGQLGWETSYLGYPMSDEFSIAGGRRSNFQYGYITWNSSTGVVSDFHY